AWYVAVMNRPPDSFEIRDEWLAYLQRSHPQPRRAAETIDQRIRSKERDVRAVGQREHVAGASVTVRRRRGWPGPPHFHDPEVPRHPGRQVQLEFLATLRGCGHRRVQRSTRVDDHQIAACQPPREF